MPRWVSICGLGAAQSSSLVETPVCIGGVPGVRRVSVLPNGVELVTFRTAAGVLPATPASWSYGACPVDYAGGSLYASGTGQVSLPVSAGQRGDVTGIYSTGTGSVYFSLDGSPATAAGGLSRGRAGAAPTVIKDIDLSLFRAAGSAGGSGFTVTYRVRVP